MKLKILHLSDLHFTANNISQDVVMSSLSKKIEKLCIEEAKPNMLVLTGDIAFSGKTEEYTKAKEFIDKIAQYCGIGVEGIFIIPGNHDVDRSKLEKASFNWYYKFTNEEELNDILTSQSIMSKIQEGTKAYFEFIKQYMTGKTTIGSYGQFVSSIPFGANGLKVNIIGLNSAIFCGYNGDDQKKLALGLSQVNSCSEKINIGKEVIISCIHHPFECFHSCEKPTLSTLERISDIILSGHVHDANNSAHRGSNSGETVFVTAGAGFERRTTQNGFNVIEIDSDTLNGTVEFYKYMPDEHLWIKNKDINHETDGVFNFQIKKGLNGSEKKEVKQEEINNDSQTYRFVLDGKFDELDRDKYKAIETHLKNIFKDVNGTIIKVEKSSIKIYFETSNEIPEHIQEELKKIDGLEILEINKADDEIHLKANRADKSVYHWKTSLKPKYSEKIGNAGATFIHSRAEDDLTLKDLYVSPNLKVISIGENAKEKVEKIVNAEKALTKQVGSPIKLVIYGAESSGKTTLVKWWYDKYYEQGYIPILLSGNEIKDIHVEKIKKVIQKEFANQYNEILEGNLDEFDPDRIIIIIDDFHKIRFTNSKYKANLISNLNKTFQNVFLTGNDLMQFETYNSKTGIARNILEDFHRYQIIEFGPTLRYELIKKWNGIGSDQLEPNELIRLNNETERHVESIIGKSFVPSYPIYLLTILQAKEASTAQKPEYSIHGFYYELLINEALNKAVRNKADISLYYNFITDYSYFLFTQKIRMRPLFIDDFIKFHNQYCVDYKIDISPKIILDTLVNSKLLRIDDDTVTITYKYVYYFFVARYLAINISNEHIKNKVKLLCQRVHRDEFASIVMFLTHLSKDQFVLNQLLENSKELFKEYQPLKLEDDVSFVNDMIKKLPEQVYQPIDIETIKQEELREEEELDEQEKEFDAMRDVLEYDIEEDITSLDVLSTMIKAIKTIEIVGQVTKKYWGELKAQQKYELAEETYLLGLRTLGFYFSLIGKDTEMLVEYLKHIYRKKHLDRNISKEDIDKASRNFLFGLCALSTFGIIKRVTNAIGYEKLAGTFQDILTNNNFNSVKLIDASIKLDHNKSFPWTELDNVKKDTDKNYLASIVLSNLVINYLHVFITSEEEKQKLCQKFGIRIEQQRMIDATSQVKRETPK
ncbi:MAG: metallophosphoesterase [Bacteroidia bacterium]|nr:metallophosphoesterase [Bacteroidia bacterium]